MCFDSQITDLGVFGVGQSVLTAVNFSQAALRVKNFTSIHCTPSFTSINISVSQS